MFTTPAGGRTTAGSKVSPVPARCAELVAVPWLRQAAQKLLLYTKVGDQICGVGYY
jgi:hypothetical protein